MHASTATDRIKRFIRHYGTVIGAVVILIAFALSTPYFFTVENFLLILKQMSMLTIVSLGFAFVMAAGGFDMSIGYAMGLANVILASTLNATSSLMAALGSALGIGLGVGFINGVLVAYLHIPDFIGTFAVGSITFGAKMLYSGGHPIFIHHSSPAFLTIGQGYLGPIPMPVVIMIVALVIGILVLHRTKFGRHIYAIGGNPMAALYAGINVRRNRFYTFLISGLSVAVTSIVLTSRMGSGQPQAGENFLLDAISVCFLSTTMFGEGEPTGAGVFVGAFIITMLNNGLTMLNVPYHVQFITKGVVVILAVLLSVALGRKIQIKLL